MPLGVARLSRTLVTLAGRLPGAEATQGTPAPQDVADSLQKKYDTIRDFSADFVHTYEGGVLKPQARGARHALREEARQDALELQGA